MINRNSTLNRNLLKVFEYTVRLIEIFEIFQNSTFNRTDRLIEITE